MMKKRLIFFTMSYPYGKGEAFIENEIPYLAEEFKEITIFPLFHKESPESRSLPDNCQVIKPVFSTNTDLILKGIFCSAPIIYFIRHYFKEKAWVSFTKTLKYIATAIRCRAILANRNFNVINNSESSAIIYFYWGIGFAYILPFIKSKTAKIVRFHGTDLYLERRKNKYIPFREDVYNNLTKAVFISEQGLEYAKKTWSKLSFVSYLSYLGTKNYGVCPTSKTDNKIHILSCSNVIKVKRVNLILKALLLIPSEFEIEWTHIGSGPEFRKLKEDTIHCPPNLTIIFKDAMLNQDVIRYYQSTPIDLFVNVSASEGLPVAIMEAISFNIPVIATNVGGTSEIVTTESGILLSPDFKTYELAQSIIYLYQNKQDFHPRQLWQKKFRADINYPRFIKETLLS